MRNLVYSIILVASSAGAALASEPARVTNLNVTQESDRSRIEIDLSRSVESSVRRVLGAPMLICELTGCLPNPGLATRAVDGRQVRSIRVFPQGDVTLVEITLGSPDFEYRYFNVRNTPRFVIDIMEPRPGSRGAPGDASTRLPSPLPLGGVEEMTAASDSSTTPAKPAEAKKAKGDDAKKKEASKPASPKSGKSRDAKGASKTSAESEMAALLEKARKLIGEGELAKGLAYLEVAASTIKDPDEKTHLFLLAARTGKAEGLCAQSARFYERLAKLSLPESLAVVVRVELGECRAAIGDAEGATAMFGEALAMARTAADSSLARRARAEHLLALDAPTEARGDLEALALRGRDAMERAYASYRLGVLLSAAGEIDGALAAFAAIPIEAPAGADSLHAYVVRAALVRRADMLYRAERFADAVPLYERAAQSAPDPDTASWAVFQIANSARRSGRYAEAIARYEELATRWPESRWAKMARWGEGEANWLLEESGAAKGRVAKASGTTAG